MGVEQCKTVQFDVEGVMSGLIGYYVEFMKTAEEKTLEVMRKELEQNGRGPRASSDRIDKWKEFVSQYLKQISREVARNYIESKVGVETRNDEVYRKAIIIADGGGPRWAGPAGRIVWDENYTGMHPSASKRHFKLPASWRLSGNKWADNAAKKLKVYFYDLLDAANDALPDSIFSGNLRVT